VGLSLTIEVQCQRPGTSGVLSCQDYPQAAHQFYIEETETSGTIVTPAPTVVEASCNGDDFSFVVIPRVAGAHLNVMYQGTTAGEYVGGGPNAVSIERLWRGRAWRGRAAVLSLCGLANANAMRRLQHRARCNARVRVSASCAAALTAARCRVVQGDSAATIGDPYTLDVHCQRQGGSGAPAMSCTELPQEALNFGVAQLNVANQPQLIDAVCLPSGDFRLTLVPTAKPALSGADAFQVCARAMRPFAWRPRRGGAGRGGGAIGARRTRNAHFRLLRLRPARIARAPHQATYLGAAVGDSSVVTVGCLCAPGRRVPLLPAAAAWCARCGEAFFH